MMKKIVFFLVLLFIFSCTSNTIFKKPDDLIPKDTMEMLMVDMTIASSAKYYKNKNLEKNINYMPLIYAKYKIDSLRFDKSTVYYTSKLDDYKKILDGVRSRLENIKKEFVDEKSFLANARKDSIKRKDSIRRLNSRNKKLELLKNSPNIKSLSITDSIRS